MLDREMWGECSPRLMVPYGVWGISGDRCVLFNRQYWPILAKVECGPNKRLQTVPCDPGWWVPYTKVSYLWNDGSTPYRRYGKRSILALEKVNSLLSAWHVPTLPREMFFAKPQRQATEHQRSIAVRIQDVPLEKRKAPWAFWFPGEPLYRGVDL